MLNCAATYRRTDKKLFDNKLNTCVAKLVYDSKSEKILGGVADMFGIKHNCGTTPFTTIDTLTENLGKSAIETASITDVVTKAVDSSIINKTLGKHFAPLPGNRHRSPG